MSKVKLPKEVAHAIETLHMADISNYGIVAMTLHKIGGPDKLFTPSVKKSFEVVRAYTFMGMEDEDIEWKVSDHDGPNAADKLLQALVNGYEVEQTPEDKVRDLYEHWDNWPGANNCFSSETIASVIIDVVNTLGHTIKGVNDHD